VGADYCPACAALRTVVLVVELRTVEEGDGVLRTRRIETRHCQTCGRFVSSEERDLTPEDSASSA